MKKNIRKQIPATKPIKLLVVRTGVRAGQGTVETGKRGPTP